MSETARPAPGPWSWAPSGKPGGSGDFNIYITDAGGRKIAAVWGKRGEKQATANLLTKAYLLPELLGALKLIDQHVRPSNWDEMDEDFEEDKRAAARAWRLLDTILEKASS